MTTLKFGGFWFGTGNISWNLVLLELFLFSAFLKCQRMFFEEILFWYAKTSEGCQSGLEGFIFFLQCLLVRKGQHCLPNGNWFTNTLTSLKYKRWQGGGRKRINAMITGMAFYSYCVFSFFELRYCNMYVKLLHDIITIYLL